METKLPVDIHPAATIFPMIDGDGYEALKKDIEENGVQVCMTFYDGKLLDGRNRYRACIELGIDPAQHSEDLDPDITTDPIGWVVSVNLMRRHLTTSQRSMIGAKVKSIYEAEAKERQKEHGGTAPGKPKDTGGKTSTSEGKSRDKAGAAVGVSGKSIDQAKKVMDKGSEELQKSVSDGKLSLAKAAKIAAEVPGEQQVGAIQEALKPKPRKPKEKSPLSTPEKKAWTAVEKIRRLLPEAEDKLVVARDLFNEMDEWQRDQLPNLWKEWQIHS